MPVKILVIQDKLEMLVNREKEQVKNNYFFYDQPFFFFLFNFLRNVSAVSLSWVQLAFKFDCQMLYKDCFESLLCMVEEKNWVEKLFATRGLIFLLCNEIESPCLLTVWKINLTSYEYILKKREQQGSLIKLVFGRISITCNLSNFKDDICNLLC